MGTPSAARTATRVTTSVSFCLVVLKTIVGLATGSVAVIASAVDSALDFLVSLFNMFAVRGSKKPRDDNHNYGHVKIEGLAALLEGLFILGSALFVLWKSVDKLLHPRVIEQSGVDLALAAMVVSMAASAVLVWFLKRMSKRTRSLVLEADALHYRTDVWSNGAVLAGMLVLRFTGWQAADALIAGGIGIYIAAAAVPLIRKGLDMLLDHALPESVTAEIAHIAATHSPLVNGVHEIRTRRSGEINFVDFHLVLDEEIPLGIAHRVADEIEARIRALDDVRWSINIHLDPVDDSHKDRKREAGMG